MISDTVDRYTVPRLHVNFVVFENEDGSFLVSCMDWNTPMNKTSIQLPEFCNGQNRVSEIIESPSQPFLEDKKQNEKEVIDALGPG